MDDHIESIEQFGTYNIISVNEGLHRFFALRFFDFLRMRNFRCYYSWCHTPQIKVFFLKILFGTYEISTGIHAEIQEIP